MIRQFTFSSVGFIVAMITVRVCICGNDHCQSVYLCDSQLYRLAILLLFKCLRGRRKELLPNLVRGDTPLFRWGAQHKDEHRLIFANMVKEGSKMQISYVYGSKFTSSENVGSQDRYWEYRSPLSLTRTLPLSHPSPSPPPPPLRVRHIS